MSAASSATFWLLMQRWHVPDEQALKLIGFEGGNRSNRRGVPVIAGLWLGRAQRL